MSAPEPTQVRSTAARRIAPLAIALVAFLIRLVYILQSRAHDPTFAQPMLDSRWHLQWALGIAQGNLLGDGVFFRAPLYPYFLGFLIRVFGTSFTAVKISQALVGSLTVVLIYYLAERLGGRRTAVVAEVIAAVYGPLVYLDGELMLEGPYLALMAGSLLGALVALERMTLRWWLLAGLVFGLAAIARPNGLALVPFLLAWMAWEIGDRRRWASAAAAWFLAFLIPVAGVTARNGLVGGEYVLIASQGGVNFYIGNNPLSDGKTASNPAPLSPAARTGNLYRDTVELSGQYEAERASGRKLKPGEVSSYWYRKAFEYIRSDPIGWLKLTFKKTYFLLNGHEIPSERQLYRIRDWSPLLGWLMVDRPIGLPFGLLLPLAAAGMFSLATAKCGTRPLEPDERRARAAHRLLTLYLAIYALTVIGFFVTSRHRIPLVPALIPYAAFALVGAWIWVRTRQGDLRRIVAALLVFLAAFALGNTRAWGVRDDVEAVHYLNLGLAYLRLDRYEDAVRELDAAVEREPSFANAWFNKGLALLEMKRYDEAIDAFQRTLKIDPLYAPAWSHLGNVSFERGLLGVAEGYFRRALEIDPHLAVAHMNLGIIFRERGDAEGYVRQLQAALDSDPYCVDANLRMAEHYARAGQPDKAAPLLRNVLRVEPQNREALRFLKEVAR